MALSVSSPFAIAVAQAAPFKPPYGLPAAGQAVLIGTNNAETIRPPSHGAGDWSYSLFGSYGGGCFVAEHSVGGAYVIAGTGGHNAPPNFGAAVFDFADATWRRIDNANGMAWAASEESARGTWQNVDYTFRGTNFEGAPTYYSDLSLGLINDGEVLIDDISVRR